MAFPPQGHAPVPPSQPEPHLGQAAHVFDYLHQREERAARRVYLEQRHYHIVYITIIALFLMHVFWVRYIEPGITRPLGVIILAIEDLSTVVRALGTQ